MHPQLIPGLPFQTFGLCVALGVFLGWQVIDHLARLTRRDAASPKDFGDAVAPRDFSGLLLLLVTVGILGARAAHVIEYWHVDGFDRNFLRAFAFWEGGLVFYGGLIAATVAFLVWWRVRRERFFAVADVLAVALPLGHAFGRLGCFFNGCCWGKASNAWYAVRFPATSFCGSAPVIPTQLVESASLFVLFGVLYFVYRRWQRYTAAIYLMAYGVLRFFIEFLRADDRPDFAGLSSAQCVSVGLVVLGVIFLACNVQSARHHR